MDAARHSRAGRVARDAPTRAAPSARASASPLSLSLSPPTPPPLPPPPPSPSPPALDAAVPFLLRVASAEIAARVAGCRDIAIGVFPSPFRAVRSAPAANRASTHRRCPASAATCKGVSPRPLARECSAPCSRSTRTASSHPCSHERVRATLKAADRIDLVRSRGTAAYPSSSMARSSSVALRCAPEMSAARKLATVCSNDDIESSRRIARFDAALCLPPRTAVCRAETCSPPHLGTPDGTITIFLGINVVSCPGGSGTHQPRRHDVHRTVRDGARRD